MEITTEARLSLMLDRLEQHYGKVKVLLEESTLDQAIFLILREGWDYKKATRALRLLQSEYVDWNEVRVSTAGEITNLLSNLSDNIEERCERLLDLLDRVYRDHNQVSLGFLRDMEFDARKEYLETIEQLSPAHVWMLLQMLADPDELLMTFHALRVASRVGLIPKTTSIPAGTRHYRELLAPSDWVRLHALTVQHGVEVCKSKNYRCESCCVNEMCEGAKLARVEAQ